MLAHDLSCHGLDFGCDCIILIHLLVEILFSPIFLQIDRPMDGSLLLYVTFQLNLQLVKCVSCGAGIGLPVNSCVKCVIL